MNKFVLSSEVPRDELDWGSAAWLCHPPSTKNKDLTVIEATFLPGKGHDFHRHPEQEEMIYCLKGQVEQWIGEKKRVLNPGDSAFIDADMVHASFNRSEEPAVILAVLGPCVGEEGYSVIEVADEEPWKSLGRD